MRKINLVIEVFQGNFDLELSQKEIIARLGGGLYYCNTSKHLGQVLRNGAKNGYLVKIRRGVYRLGRPSLHNKRKPPKINNQKELF